MSELSSKMFRFNVGMAWTGDKMMRLKNGDMLIKNPRPFKAGPPKGYPDLSGWTPVTITKDMVGKTVAVFTGCEVKTDKGRTSPKQAAFLSCVRSDGGIAFVARNDKDCEKAIMEFKNGEDE